MRDLGPVVRVWADLRERGRCKYCRRPIVWLTTDAGQPLPFNVGFTVRETMRHPAKQIRLALVARSDQHDCAEKRDARRPRGQQARQRRFF